MANINIQSPENPNPAIIPYIDTILDTGFIAIA